MVNAAGEIEQSGADLAQGHPNGAGHACRDGEACEEHEQGNPADQGVQPASTLFHSVVGDADGFIEVDGHPLQTGLHRVEVGPNVVARIKGVVEQFIDPQDALEVGFKDGLAGSGGNQSL